MKEMAWSELKRLNLTELRKLMPIRIMADGEPFALFADPKGIVVVQDLPPVMAARIRGTEMTARRGMPKDQKVYIHDVLEARSEA